jgi:hypothetical protein
MSEHIGSVRQGEHEYTIVLDDGAPGFYQWELLATSWIPEHGYERGSTVTAATGRATAREAAVAQAHDALCAVIKAACYPKRKDS